ncbi:MAG: glutamate racemase [Cytophagales bacterium]|nr:glutamate racemase [Cytophagales bacterium]MCA6368450.1 glutamate racemase [Cytophagales bacterium]MCA6371770.1 glutamate racemase [Cytophagales bacterium]MCA6376421.1 glutamate racemase [Cytophagales bacterium]MCA6384969.1 glutamate racemase [Cytophagales bacterium]
MNQSPSSPIGIFDSGIGGLTVAHAIHQQLPHEQIIYFGDTAHLPYGDKSEAAIQAYSIKIVDLLLQKGCKVIVIACNSASSAAYELLKEYVGYQAHIINVIDPMVELVASTLAGKKVGLIGTKRTVQSGIYARKIKEINPKQDICSLATPLLAPMIEEGFFNSQISHEIIANYLTDPLLNSIDALILACTHYPLIHKEINDFYKYKIITLDSASVVSKKLSSYLSEQNLMNTLSKPVHHFMVSDFTESFEASTKIFFGHEIKLDWYPLWK